MNFKETAVEGCFVLEPASRRDDRGFFSRVFDADSFAKRGLAERFVQFNNSLSLAAGTLRGLHYQVAPWGEDKLVRCLAGAIYDVVLDLRRRSPTFGRSVGVELSADNRLLIYAPKGCAHGFLTLADDTELLYFVSAPYSGESERIIRWNDPSFAIGWPREPRLLSDKDRDASNYDPATHASGY